MVAAADLDAGLVRYPRKYRAPGREAIATTSVLAVVPLAADFANRCSSKTVAIAGRGLDALHRVPIAVVDARPAISSP